MRALSRRLGRALALTALLLVTACGNEGNEITVTPPPDVPDSPGATTAATPDPGATATASAGAATTVTATLVDYEIQLSETSFTPGTYTFEVVQEGEQPHAMSIAGPGVEDSTDILEEVGATEDLIVTLDRGTYELWCPVDNHRELGMETTIEVS